MKDDMGISPDQAQLSLSDIQSTITRTRRAMTGGASGPIITVWGLVWIAGYVLTFLFSAGTPPPAPYPNCGLDPTADQLGCNSFPPCP